MTPLTFTTLTRIAGKHYRRPSVPIRANDNYVDPSLLIDGSHHCERVK